MNIREILKETTKNYRIRLDGNQLDRFETYYRLLVDWNKKINLTAITAPAEVAVKHFADCLALFNYIDIPEGASVIDVGTGAGFPGVVMKIARPDIELTLLDSLNKRLVFLEEVLKAVNLNAEIVHSRAEDGARDERYREKFDFSASRAVARLNVLSEYCLPYVKSGGSFLALKGPKAEEELAGAESAVKLLGGKLKNCFKFTLPSDGGERTLLEIQKIKSTPGKFPRNPGKIKSHPLVS